MLQFHRPQLIAWCGVLLASTLPGIVWGEFVGTGDPLWLPGSLWFQIAGLLLLLVVAQMSEATRKLTRSLLMLIAFVVGWRLLTPLWFESDLWSEWLRSLPTGVSLTVSRVQWLPPALCMSACLIGSGFSRQDLSLKTGAWNGPVRRDWVFPFRGASWPALFVGYAILTCTIGPAVWVYDQQPDFADLHQIVDDLPGIVTGSVLNAALEELLFRMLLLAVLVPAVGAAHAIALTGVLFGFEHCGTAGLLGIVLSTYTGWLYAKSMLETGGCRWALLQHVLGDVPVYAIVALARE